LAARPPDRQEKSGGRGGPLHPGDLLAPACPPPRLRPPWGRLLPPTRHRSRAATGRRPTPGPRLPRHPRIPRRLTPRRFTFQDEGAGSSPARPTTPAPDQWKRWSAVVRVRAGLDHPIRDEVNRGPKPTSPSTSLTSNFTGRLAVP